MHGNQSINLPILVSTDAGFLKQEKENKYPDAKFIISLLVWTQRFTYGLAVDVSGVMVILVGLVRFTRLSGLGLVGEMVFSSGSLRFSSSEMTSLSLPKAV